MENINGRFGREAGRQPALGRRQSMPEDSLQTRQYMQLTIEIIILRGGLLMAYSTVSMVSKSKRLRLIISGSIKSVLPLDLNSYNIKLWSVMTVFVS